MTVHPLRLLPGMELKQALLDFVRNNSLEGAFILTCCGSVSKATLRFAKRKDNPEQVATFDEYFEICSLVGTLCSTGSGHLHTVLGRGDGSTVSGHVVGDMIIHTTAEIVLGNCCGVHFTRKVDNQTGFPELDIVVQDCPP